MQVFNFNFYDYQQKNSEVMRLIIQTKNLKLNITNKSYFLFT